MTKLTAKTTIYLDPKLKRALKLSAADTGKSVSSIINNLLGYMEDLYDANKAFKREGEETVAFKDVLEECGLSYHNDILKQS